MISKINAFIGFFLSLLIVSCSSNKQEYKLLLGEWSDPEFESLNVGQKITQKNSLGVFSEGEFGMVEIIHNGDLIGKYTRGGVWARFVQGKLTIDGYIKRDMLIIIGEKIADNEYVIVHKDIINKSNELRWSWEPK